MIPTSTSHEKEIIGYIKGRIHNDLSSSCLAIGALMSAFRAGGDISPFEDTIIKRENNNSNNPRSRAEKILSK
jgi:hypothetical protein